MSDVIGILLFECQDQKGIVAAISHFLSLNDANIVSADQHCSDPKTGTFYLRIGFSVDNDQQIEAMRGPFEEVGQLFRAKWAIHPVSRKRRMGILVSKQGHCLNDLLNRWSIGELAIDIPFVIGNHTDQESLVHHYDLPFYYVPTTDKTEAEKSILELAKDSSDGLILARYMQILSGNFLKAYGKDIINIHHSFLPSFKGANPYKQAYDRGVKLIGATAHYVTEDLDEGPIIAQDVQHVSHRDSAEDLKELGGDIEKTVLARAVKKHAEFKIIRNAKKTVVF